MAALTVHPPSAAPDLEGDDSQEHVTAMALWFKLNFVEPARFASLVGPQFAPRDLSLTKYNVRKELLRAFPGAVADEIEAAVSRIQRYGATEWFASPYRIDPLREHIRRAHAPSPRMSTPPASSAPTFPARPSGKRVGIVMVVALTMLLLAAIGWAVL